MFGNVSSHSPDALLALACFHTLTCHKRPDIFTQFPAISIGGNNYHEMFAREIKRIKQKHFSMPSTEGDLFPLKYFSSSLLVIGNPYFMWITHRIL